MSLWAWVLAGLCAVAVALTIVSIVSVVIQGKRLSERLRTLQNSRLFLAVASLQMQGARLSRLGADVQPLAERLARVRESMTKSSRTLSLTQPREALCETGDELSSLIDVLR